LTLFVYLERFRRYSTFFIWLGFLNTGGEIFGVLGQNDPKTSNERKNTCREGTLLCQIASFEPFCVKLSLSVWPVQVRKKKKAGRQEGRKEEKSQEVYISRLRGATPSG